MKVYHAFGAVPASVLPSQPIRYWHHAILIAVALFWTAYVPLLLALDYALGDGPMQTLSLGVQVLLWLAMAGLGEHGAVVSEYVGTFDHPWLMYAGLGLSFALAAALALWVGYRVSLPQTRQFHVSGDELKRGQAAHDEAARVMKDHDPENSQYVVWITDTFALTKAILSRHVLMMGGVGAGKTVLLKRFVNAFVRGNNCRAKALIYDVKGDLTEAFPECPIVSVEDERTRLIPLGKVIQTKKQASIFMQSIIPDDRNGNHFFTSTARLVGVGVIQSLMDTKPKKWGAVELAEGMNKQAPVLAEIFKKHDPKAAQALGDPKSKTAMDIMATVASYTRIFDELARAWGPYRYNTDGTIKRVLGVPIRRKEWNPLDWMKDGYKGKRCIILQGGGDQQITHGLISAIINLLTPEIVSPALKDDQENRCLAFVLDEMPTIGKIADFERLAVAGRSKGVVMICCYQDRAQMTSLYSPEMTQTIESTCLTHLVFQMNRGETREHIAKSFSSRFVGSVSHADGRVHEEGKAVVYADEITRELGKREGSKEEFGPLGWGIRFLCAIGGYNPMILTAQGKNYPTPKPRDGQIQGPWMKPQKKPQFQQNDDGTEGMKEGAFASALGNLSPYSEPVEEPHVAIENIAQMDGGLRA